MTDWKARELYLIEILHQTTTMVPATLSTLELYLIEILHQTTTQLVNSSITVSCILLKFYIKPQLDELPAKDYLVVSY